MGLVVGAEGSGIRRLTAVKCDLLVHIPMAGEGGLPQRLGCHRHLPVQLSPTDFEKQAANRESVRSCGLASDLSDPVLASSSHPIR